MNAFNRISNIITYEWSRAIARKKILLLIGLTVVFEVAPFAVLSKIPILTIPSRLEEIIWVVGALAPNGLLIQFVAIILATGAMAEEYEQGTSDILLTKPLKRAEYLTGKILGAYTLLAAIIALTTLLAVVVAISFFGFQRFLAFAPVITLSIIFASSTSFALGFAFGEFFRRTNLSYLAVSTILIVVIVMSGFLFLAFNLTRDVVYLQAEKSLPAWGFQNFPVMVARNLFLGEQSLSPLNFAGPQAPGTIYEAALSILIYTVTLTTLAFVRFIKTDVSRRTN